MTLIINQTLSTGIFQSKLKTTKVIPVYKKNDKTLLKNYRPISVLPVVSKIIENVMHNQMMDYFTSNELFSSQQYGFRPNRSTELAVLELMDRNMCSILTKGSTCRKNKKLRFFLILIEQVMTNLLKKNLAF